MLRHCYFVVAIFLALAAPVLAFAPPLPRRPRALPSIHVQPQHLNNIPPSSYRNRIQLKAHKSNRLSFRKRASRALTSLAFALSIFLKSTSPALAVKEELRANDIIMNSLRPGISAEEAESINKGEVVQDDTSEVVLGQSSTNPKGVEVDVKKVKTKSVYDYGEEYEEEDDEIDFEFEGDVTQSDVQKDWLDGGETNAFAMTKSSGPTKKMYITAATSILVLPVTWLQTREFLRGRREQQYVEKGLKILEAQKAEYFNVTSSADDADIEDELKDLKDKDDDGDDDDDDDDDEDDDDDDDDEDDDDDDDDYY